MPIIQTADLRRGALPEMVEAGEGDGHRLADGDRGAVHPTACQQAERRRGPTSRERGSHMCDNIP